jgi:hypothetical protein
VQVQPAGLRAKDHGPAFGRGQRTGVRGRRTEVSRWRLAGVHGRERSKLRSVLIDPEPSYGFAPSLPGGTQLKGISGDCALVGRGRRTPPCRVG